MKMRSTSSKRVNPALGYKHVISFLLIGEDCVFHDNIIPYYCRGRFIFIDDRTLASLLPLFSLISSGPTGNYYVALLGKEIPHPLVEGYHPNI